MDAPPPESTLPAGVADLLDDLDQELRSLPTARALTARNTSQRLALLTLDGLKLLLQGQRERATQTLEAVVDELSDQTMTLQR